METRTEIIKAELANGTIVHIQATALGGEEEVAFILPSFQKLTDAIGRYRKINSHELTKSKTKESQC